MSTISLISPQQNLVDEIVPLLVPDGRDFSNNIVVFPGKRPAHMLRRALASRTGKGFIPPKIFSIDHFIDYLCEEKLQAGLGRLEPLDAVALLHDIYLADPQRLGGGHFIELDAFLPLGMKIFGELEELWLADVPLRRVKDALSGIVFGGLTSLLVFYEQLYATAGQRRLATRSMRYRFAAEKVHEIDFRGTAKIIFAGFFAFTKSEEIIFKHFSTLENVVEIFQNGLGIGNSLKQLGLSPEIPQRDSAPPSLHFTRSADDHGQVFALSEKIHEKLKADPASIEGTSIVVPAAETLFPLFHQTLALLPDDTYNISLGYPATRTPVYGFLETVMELAVSKNEGRYAIPSYVKFILHPYTKNIRYGNRSDVTRILCNTIEEIFLKERPDSYFALEELEKNIPVFERAAQRVTGAGEKVSAEMLRGHLIAIHKETIVKLSDPKSIGDFAARAIDVLKYIDARSTARLHPFFRPFAEALIENLDAISASSLSGMQFPDLTGYVLFFRNYVASAEVPFTGTPLHGLQVLGFLETRNLQFDTVFVLDANDDIIPGNKGHDVLLPLKLRESLGLPTFRDRERVAEYYFDLLLHGAKEVHFFFTEGGKKEKSRFLEKLLWENEQRDRRLSGDEYIRTVQYRVNLANHLPNAIPKTAEVGDFLKSFAFTATALDTYVRCQLRFYYAFVLQLRERAEISGELEQTEIGSFIHFLLASYFRTLKGKHLTKNSLTLSSFEEFVDRCFSSEFGPHPVGAVFLLKKQISTHLKDFFLRYQIPESEKGITIMDVELKLESSIGEYKIKGTLDRVELRGQKKYILDYKTGASEKYTKIHFDKLDVDNRASWGEAIGSLQLPFYAILYAKATSTPLEQIMPAYLFLGKQELDSDIEDALFGDEDAAKEKFAMLEKVTVGLMDEITDEDHPFAPTENFEKECRGCAFKYICGTQWIGD
ncbi:MAG TPA: PD-(D/E)XK nuclease family protein [Bacteroidota bacterium]|nr:PD-(D/E)XK nuclease family protein [Bacteroidota bacterium]